MSSDSPVVPLRTPKRTTGKAPAALRQRGIFEAREMLPEGARLRCPRAIWVFYGQQLAEHFIRQPAKES